MSPPRRLVLLLDGTWNEDAAHDQDTNVVRLRTIIAKSVTSELFVPRSIAEVNKRDSASIEINALRWQNIDYLFFYERGVGTGPGFDRLFGGGLGWGLGQNIRRAYKFLCEHYVPGSEIFIFGFSRGSYTARSLVGYLGSAGLLQAEYCTMELEQQAWAYYRTSPNDRLPGIRKSLEKYVHSVGELRVACLGVFDTVGTLGIPSSIFRRLNRQNYEFHDVDLSPIVKLNLHALAIDEQRSQFEASVWRQTRFKVSNSVTEQTWFPGVHADVGGGYFSYRARTVSRVRALDDVTLDWMLKRILHHYPDFPFLDNSFPQISGTLEKLGPQHNSRTWQYRFLRPAIRAIGNLKPPVRNGEIVVSYDRDTTVVGESIHISAIERLAQKAPIVGRSEPRPYLPRNLIENIPNLYERYCLNQNPSLGWGAAAVSITSWDGEILDPTDSKDEALQQARVALEEAGNRMKSLGFDILSPLWDSSQNSQALAAAGAV
jgi:hypothetical protein